MTFSALGIAASDLQRFYVKAEPMIAPGDLARINAIYTELERQAAADLQRAGFGSETSLLVRSVEPG